MVFDLVKDNGALKSRYERLRNRGFLTQEEMAERLWHQAATGAGAGLVLGLRLCQVYIPGRSAEITDVIMWVMIAVAMRLMAGRETERVMQTK